MAQMIAKYGDDSGEDDITAKSNSRAIETKEKNLPFDGEKLGIVETLVSLMSPSFLSIFGTNVMGTSLHSFDIIASYNLSLTNHNDYHHMNDQGDIGQEEQHCLLGDETLPGTFAYREKVRSLLTKPYMPYMAQCHLS